MDRASMIAALVAFTIFATLLMFLTALIVYVLGSAAIYFVGFVCIPVVCILFLMGLVVMLVTQANVLHSLRLKWVDEEHRYSIAHKMREVELQKRRIHLHLYYHRLYAPRHRHVKIKPRPPDDLTANGC